MTSENSFSDSEQLKIYRDILPSLRFYKAHLPKEAKSYSLKIYHIENGEKTVYAAVEDNFKSEDSKKCFKFAVGIDESFYYISINGTAIINRVDDSKKSLKPNSARLKSFASDIYDCKLNVTYNLITEDTGPISDTFVDGRENKFEKIIEKKGHVYNVLTITFSDKEIEK